MSAALDALFAPRHVAVFGSASPDKHGYTVVRNLVRWGWQGQIFPVNREAAAIEGRAGYRTLAELPVVPDCAMLVVPAASCVEIVAECAAAGVRVAVIGASGFAELATAEGAARQREIEAIARASGMRIVGPNTNGIYNATNGFSLGYNAAHGVVQPAGDVAVISHSGALFDGIAACLQRGGANLATFVPVGNEADVTLLDVLDYLIGEPRTRVIGLVIEGLADGVRFRALAARAHAAGKPIVALKIGRSEAGAGAALAHSSRLAGGSRAYAALLREAGVAAAQTVEGMAAGCAVLSAQRGARANAGDPLIVVTTSGAGGALVADVASDRGLRLAGDDGEWPEPVASALRALGTAARIRNPIDMGTLGNWGLLAPTFAALHGAFDGPVVVYAHNAPQERMADQLADALLERKAQTATPILVLTPGGLRPDIEARLTTAGIPVFRDTAACFEGLTAYLTTTAPTTATAPVPITAQPLPVIPSVAPQREVEGQPPSPLLAGTSPLNETQSAELLRRYGLPVVESIDVRSPEGAGRAATRTGYPLVLKALAPGVAHKHAAGFVIVGIATPEALAAAYAALEARVAAAGFARADVPFIVQPLLRGEVELIAGVSREAALGHFLVFGFGGVHAEAFDDVTLLPIPVAVERIGTCIAASRVGRVLRAVERQPGALTGALASVLAGLQRFVIEHGDRVASVDVNPLLASRDALIAVDALVVPQ
jgi:acyl-CoA synthetase (NDP forming)